MILVDWLAHVVSEVRWAATLNPLLGIDSNHCFCRHLACFRWDFLALVSQICSFVFRSNSWFLHWFQIEVSPQSSSITRVSIVMGVTHKEQTYKIWTIIKLSINWLVGSIQWSCRAQISFELVIRSVSSPFVCVEQLHNLDSLVHLKHCTNQWQAQGKHTTA